MLIVFHPPALFAHTVGDEMLRFSAIAGLVLTPAACLLYMRVCTKLQDDEKVLQVEAAKGETQAIEESDRRMLPLELPLPPSFSSLFCKPKRTPARGLQQP
eukprot:COSAG03_NODE_123_length_12291_cov_19.979413_9_plen_101_part_00